MIMVCSQCDISKPLTEFYDRGDSKNRKCKTCCKNNSKIYRDTNKDTIKEYHSTNSKRISDRKKKWYLKNKESIRELQKTYRENNPDYYIEYYYNNKDQVFAYRRNRLKTDPLFALTCRIRRLVNITITNRGYFKKSKTQEILGIDWSGLKEHFERQFVDGMNWENRDRWHIDHIIPLATAQCEDDVIRLNHYTNLQPLWAEDNIRKGSKIL